VIGDNSLASCPAVSVFSSQSVSALQLLSATLYSDATLAEFLFGFGSLIISVFQYIHNLSVQPNLASSQEINAFCIIKNICKKNVQISKTFKNIKT